MLLFFFLGTVLGLIVLLYLLITSNIQAKRKQAEYVNTAYSASNQNLSNQCVEKSISIEKKINEIVKTRFPSCHWEFEGNKLELPFLPFIDIRIVNDEGQFICIERLSHSNTQVEHLESI